MKLLYALFAVIIFAACDNHKKREARLFYDIQIDYLTTPLNDNRKLPTDTIVVVFDGNFEKDTVDILINGSHFKTMFLTTDERSGVAGDIKIIPYQDVKTIGLRINNGKLIFIETERKHYNIELHYLDNKAIVKFYRKLPGFM